MRTITQQNMIELGHAVAIKVGAFRSAFAVLNLMLMTDEAQMKAEYAKLQKAHMDLTPQAQVLSQLFAGISNTRGSERALLATTLSQWEELWGPFDHAAALARQKLRRSRSRARRGR